MREMADYGVGALGDKLKMITVEEFEKLQTQLKEAHEQICEWELYNIACEQQIKFQQQLIDSLLNYINESPCDPDITESQIRAYKDFNEKLTTYKQKYQ